MFCNPITFKQFIEQNYAEHMSILEIDSSELVLVKAFGDERAPVIEFTFHNCFHNKPQLSEAELFLPQELWLKDSIMSFSWIPTDSARYVKGRSQFDWHNGFRNEHYEEQEIFYIRKHFSAMKFNMAVQQEAKQPWQLALI